jgi:hypothetical protein
MALMDFLGRWLYWKSGLPQRRILSHTKENMRLSNATSLVVLRMLGGPSLVIQLSS